MQKKEKESPTSKKKTKHIAKKIFAGILVLGIVAAAIVGTIVLKYTYNTMMEAPEVSLEMMESVGSSKILDADGNVIAEVGQQIRTNITYEDLPQSLIDAFVSIEDSRFFEHNGFDISRFVKAMIENCIATMKAGKITFTQGGSTLTMQLIDNSYFKSDTGSQGDNGIEQKLYEIYMATELEKISTKEDILVYYLNKVNFGGNWNIRGVQKAAEYYFNKDVKDLTLAESAMLAGLVNAPNRYNPHKNLEAATSRRNTVLNLMVRHGYITQEEADLAKAVRVEDLLADPSNLKQSTTNSAYQSYVDAVISEVIELTGQNPTLTPMIIHTSMSQSVQNTVNQIQNGEIEGIEFPDELMQTAIVCMNNQTGEIVALGGGRYYEGERLFNRATEMLKQPGSSVKPFLSYALAFEKLGWATSHVVVDKPILYRGTDKLIGNFDGKYRGDMTLQDAIGTSMNTPAISTLQEVVDTIGRNEVIEYLNSLGFEQVNSSNFDLGYAIGGSSFTVTPVQLNAAHAAMINHGVYIEPHTVTKIEFLDGQEDIIVSKEEKQVLSEEAAYLTSWMMEKCVSGPYVNYMQILKRSYPVYAKTGTTDWGKDGLQYGIPEGAAKDKWMISSTSEYTTTVWLGYDKGIKDANTYFDSAKNKLNLPGKISSVLLDALNNEEDPPSAITCPDGIETITHILGTFPYATAEGYEHLYTSGLIKAEFNHTVSIYDNIPSQLNSITVSERNEDGSVKISWEAEGFASTNENGQKDISLSYVDKKGVEHYIEAYGAQLFSYSWIVGQPSYSAQLYLNGNYITELWSDSGTTWTWQDAGHIKACGQFSIGGKTSNTVCSE